MTDKEDQAEPDAVDSLPIVYTSTLPEPQAQLAKDVQVPEGASESVEDKAVSTAEAASSMDASKPTLSKHQQRKIARQERLLATKSERRAREKAAKKERKAEKRRLVEEEGADPYEIGLKKVKKVKTVHKFNANVVIDLGFDDKMSEKVSSITLVNFISQFKQLTSLRLFSVLIGHQIDVYATSTRLQRESARYVSCKCHFYSSIWPAQAKNDRR